MPHFMGALFLWSACTLSYMTGLGLYQKGLGLNMHVLGSSEKGSDDTFLSSLEVQHKGL